MPASASLSGQGTPVGLEFTRRITSLLSPEFRQFVRNGVGAAWGSGSLAPATGKIDPGVIGRVGPVLAGFDDFDVAVTASESAAAAAHATEVWFVIPDNGESSRPQPHGFPLRKAYAAPAGSFTELGWPEHGPALTPHSRESS